MTEIQQKPSESQIAWKIRILLQKAEGMYEDYSWTKILEMINEDEIAATRLNYIAKGMLMLKNYLMSDSEINPETMRSLTLLEKQRFALKKDKIKLGDEKNRVNRIIRETARFENVLEEFTKNLKEHIQLQPYEFKPHYTETTSKEAVLLLSDWHWGETTSNEWNDFNTTIAKQRVNELIEQVIRDASIYKPQRLHLFVLGDMINGLIHITSRLHSDLIVTEAVKEVFLQLMDMIIKLRHHFPEIVVYGVKGNHDRLIANLKESIDESFFDLIMFFLEQSINSIACMDKISFVANERDTIRTQICGKEIIAVHGDKDKKQKSIDSLSHMHQIFPDYIFMGHYHAPAEIEKGRTRLIVNGAFCGVDDYAKDKRLFSKPSQTLIIMDKDDFFAKFDINFKAGVKVTL